MNYNNLRGLISWYMEELRVTHGKPSNGFSITYEVLYPLVYFRAHLLSIFEFLLFGLDSDWSGDKNDQKAS